jgi:hypothetical protein
MSELAWFGREIFTRATEANVVAMEKSVVLVEENAKKIMGTGATSGKKSRRSGKGKSRKFHRPSAPGEPPAIDIGILKSSVAHKIEKKETSINGFVGSDIDHIRKRAGAGTDVQYGFYLEVGTVKMQARPWLRPALRQSENGILRNFKEANR